ncbi:endosomal/lysosomal proton channel TMEM175 isoform X3 [Nerophis lumbriciformis]|uniref:endosomal/lysosomal proton channel TMEM175 isoform X3 n=2 Tax=Nerophis lumbriciformis TaxID=546530 RepID=UPI003BAA3A18
MARVKVFAGDNVMVFADPSCGPHQDGGGRGVQAERPASSHHQDRRLPDDFPHRLHGLGRPHQSDQHLLFLRGASRLFQVIVRIDDCVALLNLACMMLITFLPYTVSMASPFAAHVGTRRPLFAVLADGRLSRQRAGDSSFLRLRHGPRRPPVTDRVVRLQPAVPPGPPRPGVGEPHLLQASHPESSAEGSSHVPLCQHLLLSPVPAVLRVVDCFQSYVLLAVVIFLPYVSQSVMWCRSKLLGPLGETPDSAMFFVPSEPLSKERVEAFSDGVYAIVATLLILDICEDNVPDPGVVQKRFGGSLVAALQVYGPEYLAYFGSFATVGLLWFVHHSLFLHVTKATRLMGLMNTLSLACVGGLPLAYQLTQRFPPDSRNELEAVQTSCVIVFFAGVFQLAMWVVALHSERETLQPGVRYGGREHVFMLAKLALYPCVALGTFFLTCVLGRFSVSIFHLVQILVPFAFLLLRLLVRLLLALLPHFFRSSGVPFNPLDA